ncbi:MAG: EscS/YscS/HrcS family type III secretion system export apparatus protein [Planctomycetota bacterium]|nr:MAG: EscS/YscS/HrcS family type III secretion system export apparatus protein [Planctomycetota bacterium]
MNGEIILFLGRRTLETGMLLAGPVLIVALISGVLVSLFQAVTSMRDMTLGVVVKIGAVGITMLIAGGWMLQVILSFTKEVFDTIQLMTQ